MGYYCSGTGEYTYLNIPKIDLSNTQCGINLAVGIGSSGSIEPRIHSSEGIYFTDYAIAKDTAQHYTSLTSMQADILIGWNAPSIVVGDFLTPVRAAAAAQAQAIWYWQANYGKK